MSARASCGGVHVLLRVCTVALRPVVVQCMHWSFRSMQKAKGVGRLDGQSFAWCRAQVQTLQASMYPLAWCTRLRAIIGVPRVSRVCDLMDWDV